jgi:hypothetical protein
VSLSGSDIGYSFVAMFEVAVLDKLLRPLPAYVNTLESTRWKHWFSPQCLEERLDKCIVVRHLTCPQFWYHQRPHASQPDQHPVSVQWEGYSAPDFSGLSWLCSHSKGDKSPKELCGLNRLYSSLHFSKCTRTSAMFSNQWVVKNSSRSFPLNDSQKALSVGLPGREKQSFTPRRYAHASKAFPANSGPLSRRIVLGSP